MSGERCMEEYQYVNEIRPLNKQKKMYILIINYVHN